MNHVRFVLYTNNTDKILPEIQINYVIYQETVTQQHREGNDI